MENTKGLAARQRHLSMSQEISGLGLPIARLNKREKTLSEMFHNPCLFLG